MKSLLYVPSFYAHVLNGLLLLLALCLLYVKYPEIIQLDAYKLLVLVLLLSLAVGVHGLSHLGLEKVYGFNPLKQN